MKQGALVTCSDESVKANVSTHGCVILPQNSKHWIHYHVQVTYTVHLLTSLRVEHSGFITIIITLHMRCQRWGLSSNIPPGTVLVDNKEVINRMQNGLPHLSIRYLSPEYDVWDDAIYPPQTFPFLFTIQ